MRTSFNIYDYDYYIVMFSGGKDSTACLLTLLDLGIPKNKIELWHHLVDGRGTSLMDWECTEDYCRKFAEAFQLLIYFSYKEGGFEGEMLRENRPTKQTCFETPIGMKFSGGKGKSNTRLQFPQLSMNLSVRWCSSYLKIDVAKSAIINQQRFDYKKLLVISGERAEESSARQHYLFFEPDGADNRNGKKQRFVDHCRIIHQWKETEVWEIIRRYNVVVHPCYYLGYHRCSCKWCIFGNANQMASSYFISPTQGNKLIEYEKQFKKTIRPGIDLRTFIAKGMPFEEIIDNPALVAQSISTEYLLPIFTHNWIMPSGAFSHNSVA